MVTPLRWTVQSLFLVTLMALAVPAFAAESATETILRMSDGSVRRGQLYGYKDGAFLISRPFGKGMFVSVPVQAAAIQCATAPDTVAQMVSLLGMQKQVLDETRDILFRDNLIREAMGKKTRDLPADDIALPEVAWDEIHTVTGTVHGEIRILSATGLLVRHLDEANHMQTTHIPLNKVKGFETANRLDTVEDMQKRLNILKRDRDREAESLDESVAGLRTLIAQMKEKKKKADSQPVAKIESETEIQTPPSGPNRLKLYNMSHRGGDQFYDLVRDLSWYYESAEQERQWRLQQNPPQNSGGSIDGPDAGRKE